jgi:hypothetical protein
MRRVGKTRSTGRRNADGPFNLPAQEGGLRRSPRSTPLVSGSGDPVDVYLPDRHPKLSFAGLTGESMAGLGAGGTMDAPIKSAHDSKCCVRSAIMLARLLSRLNRTVLPSILRMSPDPW